IALFERLGDSIALALAQRLAQKAVKQNEEKLKSIFRAAPVGIGVVVNRVFTNVNSHISEMTGYGYNELIGSNTLMLYPAQEEFDYIGRELYRETAEKGTGTIETRWKRKDGAVIDVLLSSSPIDTSDLSKGITLTALDISERKRAEKELLESEARNRLILDRSPMYVLLIRDGKFMYVNSIAARLHGYTSPGELIGLSVENTISPDCIDAIRARLENLSKGQANPPMEVTIVHPDGGKCVLESISVPIILEDGPAGLVMGIDVTERKKAEKALEKSEERLSLAMEASEYGFWDLDLDGNKMYLSPAISAMTGYEPGEMSSSVESLLGIVHADDREILLKTVEYSVANVEPFHIDFRIKHKSGDLIWASAKGKPVDIDENGRPHHIIGTQVNITARVKAEEALLYAKAAADESNRMKNEMLKNVTHELRTPLTSVLGFSDLLLNRNDQNLNSSQREYIGYIQQGGQNLLNIVDRMLDFANVEHGSPDSLRLQSVNVSEVVSETLNILSTKALKKNIAINTVIAQDLNAVADRHKLNEILYNLVENAIKFTDSGGSVKIESKSNNGDILFSIRDTGIGIAKEKLDRIFEPFVQIDGSISRKYGGTGLGLALVKKLVEMHGGKIWVESEPGNGSTFVFEIPMKPNQ
ncbi:MAG: PAS domain-containing sensor histidine kinase, partial [Methanolobus sp.]|nr:PAS domain-containing sensor histidine kinase [Methanolobus sp.]